MSQPTPKNETSTASILLALLVVAALAVAIFRNVGEFSQADMQSKTSAAEYEKSRRKEAEMRHLASRSGRPNSTQQLVINDMLVQYRIVENQGDLLKMCVHAELVANAYLQDHDEAGYKVWMNKKYANCEAAGAPK